MLYTFHYRCVYLLFEILFEIFIEHKEFSFTEVNENRNNTYINN